MIDWIGCRQRRQYLNRPANQKEYTALFRELSPVQTPYWSVPGAPPELFHRANFDDAGYNGMRRARREIVKGRFMGGNIAYVDREDLELFTCAYCRRTPDLSMAEMELLELLRREGPLTVGLIKETTGMLVKQITPVLHKLQERFLIFEDQADSGWDRGFYLFEQEFPEVDRNRYTKEEAIAEILPRFIHANGFATVEGMKTFYRFTAKELKTALDLLLEQGSIVKVQGDGKSGFILASDAGKEEAQPAVRSVFALNRNDFLVRANEAELKEKYARDEWDTLFYLLIDGVFSGAVYGKYKNGPFLLGDVRVDLPRDEKEKRKEEIIEAVYAVNDRELSPLHRYDGREL